MISSKQDEEVSKLLGAKLVRMNDKLLDAAWINRFRICLF